MGQRVVSSDHNQTQSCRLLSEPAGSAQSLQCHALSLPAPSHFMVKSKEQLFPAGASGRSQTAQPAWAEPGPASRAAAQLSGGGQSPRRELCVLSGASSWQRPMRGMQPQRSGEGPETLPEDSMCSRFCAAGTCLGPTCMLVS